MKRKRYNFLIIFVIGAIFLISVFQFFKYSHHLSWNQYKGYLWIINDSARKYIDTNYCLSLKNKRDTYTYLNLNHKNDVFIWDFNKINYQQLKYVDFSYNVDLDNIRLNSAEVFNLDMNPKIYVKRGFNFKDSLRINFDKFSKIQEIIDSPKYKGFIGTINKVSLSTHNKYQILFDYSQKNETTLFLVYSRYHTNYLIIFNSEDPISRKTLNLFNLE